MLMFAAPSAKLLVDGRVPFYGPEMIREVGEAFANPDRAEGISLNGVPTGHLAPPAMACPCERRAVILSSTISETRVNAR